MEIGATRSGNGRKTRKGFVARQGKDGERRRPRPVMEDLMPAERRRTEKDGARKEGKRKKDGEGRKKSKKGSADEVRKTMMIK